MNMKKTCNLTLRIELSEVCEKANGKITVTPRPRTLHMSVQSCCIFLEKTTLIDKSAIIC